MVLTMLPPTIRVFFFPQSTHSIEGGGVLDKFRNKQISKIFITFLTVNICNIPGHTLVRMLPINPVAQETDDAGVR